MAGSPSIHTWKIDFELRDPPICVLKPQEEQPAQGEAVALAADGVATPATAGVDGDPKNHDATLATDKHSRLIPLLENIPGNIYQYDVFLGIIYGKYTYQPNSVNGLTQALCSRLSSPTDDVILSWFRDENYAQGRNLTWLDLQAVRTAYHGKNQEVEETQTGFAVAYIFWRGIVEFLRAGDNWRKLNARFMYLVAAWQWFHLARFLAGRHYQQLTAPGIEQTTLTPRWANNELVQATRLLQTLLRDSENINAVELLYHQVKPASNTKTQNSRLTAQEQLLLSMVMVKSSLAIAIRDQTTQISEFLCGDKPVYDPARSEMSITWETGWVIENPVAGEQFNWKDLAVHPVFADESRWGLKEFVRQLIANVMLPHYQLFDALRMSYLLRRPPQAEGNSGISRSFRGLVIGLAIWLVVLLAGIPLLSFIPFFPPLAPWPDNLLYVALSWVALIATAVFLGRRLDGSVVHYLLLPRLLGGMMVGYLALALQGESFLVKKVVFASAEPIWGYAMALLILAGTLWIGFTYLKFECLSIIHNHPIAVRRALVLLLTSLIASALIGLVVVGITTAMEHLDKPDLFQNLRMIGPAGVIDLRQYLVFVPLAMLTGFVSQFIFEDKAITASVWEDK